MADSAYGSGVRLILTMDIESCVAFNFFTSAVPHVANHRGTFRYTEWGKRKEIIKKKDG